MSKKNETSQNLSKMEEVSKQLELKIKEYEAEKAAVKHKLL